MSPAILSPAETMTREGAGKSNLELVPGRTEDVQYILVPEWAWNKLQNTLSLKLIKNSTPFIFAFVVLLVT